jgi:hypothetical protein
MNLPFLVQVRTLKEEEEMAKNMKDEQEKMKDKRRRKRNG